MAEDEHRLYFIARSFIMGQISVLLFTLTVFVLGSVDALQTLIMAIFVFFASLAISRLFDPIIEWAVRKALNYLNRHEGIKNFILKHF